MSKWSFQLCMRVVVVLGVTVYGGAVALAQPTLDALSSLGPFRYQATLSADGRVVVAGDVGLLASTGVVHVFERDPATDSWTETTQLAPGDSNAGFGRSLSFDGTTAIVGGDDAAYVFRFRHNRNESGRWREVARLQPSDSAANFGAAVAVERDTALVSGGDAVYVFARTDESGWVEAGDRLTSPVLPVSGFGVQLDLSGNTAIVVKRVGPSSATVFVFERSRRGSVDWHVVNRIPEGSAGLLALRTARIDHDTIVLAGGEFPGFVAVFERDGASEETWPEVALYRTPGAGTVAGVEISGDRIALSGAVGGTQIEVLARNQGGFHAWGPVSRLRVADPRLAFGPFVAVDADTVMFDFGPASGSTLVYTFDQDGDGLRDGVDPCVRDPLNNVDGGCQRATWAYPALDDLLQRTTESITTKSNRQVITMTFTNTSTIAVRNPFFEVTDIDSRSQLLNADGHVGGVGASLSPDVGDGVLSPGESVTVSFELRVRPASSAAVFDVTFKGEPLQQ